MRKGGSPGTTEFHALYCAERRKLWPEGMLRSHQSSKGDRKLRHYAGHRRLAIPEKPGIQPEEETDMDMNNRFQSRRGPFCLAVNGGSVREDGEGKTWAELILIESSAARERGKGTRGGDAA